MAGGCGSRVRVVARGGPDRLRIVTHCFRQSVQPGISSRDAEKCLAQANSMSRQANAAAQLLQRMQADRRK